MRGRVLSVATAVLLSTAVTAQAATINFNSDPFAGAPLTPGRDIIGNELFLANFDFVADQFVFDPDFFDVTSISFINDEVQNLPSSGVNTIVLRTFDNDNDPLTPFGAGAAATLIANQLTSPGAGFFIYFNSGLNLPRLVYSTDLDDPTADLKVLVRFESLLGNQGAMSLFNASNFLVAQVVPEPGTLLLLGMAGAWAARRHARQRRAR